MRLVEQGERKRGKNQNDATHQLSELMGGMLPPVHIPSNAGHALDIGWGMGESVYEMALRYPSLHITGIDMDISIVKQAQARVNEMRNVTVLPQNILQFAEHSFKTTRLM